LLARDVAEDFEVMDTFNWRDDQSRRSDRTIGSPWHQTDLAIKV